MTNDIFVTLISSRPSQPRHTGRPGLWALIVVVLALLIVAVRFLGAAEPFVPVETPVEEERPARVYTVSYRFGVFSPTNLRIRVGDTVRFKNDGPLPIRIVAATLPGRVVPEFDSVGPVAAGSYFSYTFANIGVFAYANADEPDESGTIIVR
jgi:plastocyanin